MTGGTVIGREGRRPAIAGAIALVLAALIALAGGQRAEAGPPPEFRLVDLGNFHDPVHVSEAPDSPNVVFVVSRSGKIRVLKNGRKRTAPFLDIRDLVQAGGEEGLLSVAFHPDYGLNRQFYVYYVDNQGDIQIDQFRRRANEPLRAGLGSRRPVITIPHNQASNHNGGLVMFGPDDLLYAGIGDGGPQQDPENDAQSTGTLLGKLIRIDPLDGGSYTSPPANPYVGVEGRDEIFALGLRNPWRFSFDSLTGALTIADVGGADREEVDYVADGGLGDNFGWNDYEGFVETSFGIGGNASPHTAPIADFSHNDPDNFCAITGGYVVRDPGLPALSGQYVFSDLCANAIEAITVPAGAAGTEIGLSVPLPVSFGEGENGQIYVVALGGDVFRLEQTG
ncbi:MAG: PQQ-dependent sugar dehydrogenase [Solirubrobacterales bacterium]